MEVYSMAVFNFIIIFISLFYVMDIRLTFKRLLSCFLLNLFIAFLAAEFPDMQWLPISLCVLLGGSLFYVYIKNRFVFLHLLNIHLITMVIESFFLIYTDWVPLPLLLHGFVIILTLFACLFFYKKYIASRFIEKEHSGKSKGGRYFWAVSIVTYFIFYQLVLSPAPNNTVVIHQTKLVVLVIYFSFLLISYRLITSVWKKELEIKQKEDERYYFYAYMKELEETNKRIRSFQHDYTNILLSLNGYIKNQDIEGLAAYFDASVLKTSRCQQGSFHQLDNLEIIEIKGLIGAKLMKAQELHIRTQVEIPEKIDYIPIDLLDLSRILGILLDNAMEASVLHENPQIQVAFLQTESNDLLLVIRNSIQQPYPDMRRLFEQGYSTKDAAGGDGLFNVKQLLARYPAIMLHTYLENEWFIQEMLIERRES